MDLAKFRMFIYEYFNNDPDIVTEGALLIILDSKSYVCMDKNGNYTKHNRHIDRSVTFVINGKKCKFAKK